jgi:hypothetical protein
MHASGLCTKFAIVGDGVQGYFRAQAWRRPSGKCEAPIHQAARGCRSRANVSSQVRQAQLKFMRDKIRELEDLGLVDNTTGAEWARTPLILHKPVLDQYRMTVDLRVPNASTKPTAWPIPNLQDELHNPHDSEYLRRWIFLSRLLADTSAQKFSRLSVVHNVGCSIHTYARTTWS